MSEFSDPNDPSLKRPDSDSPPPGYYLISRDAQSASRELTLLGLWRILWEQRLLVISIGSLFAFGSIVVALLLPPVYRSDAVLAPVDMEDTSTLIDQFGGLANLAGVRLGGADRSNTTIAMLRSRSFAETFIRDHNLLRVFFAEEWDAAANEWINPESEDVPTMYDAIRYFHENVFFVQQDSATGLVTIAVEWPDPEIATDWVNELVDRINRMSREEVLSDAAKSLEYLRTQLQVASVVQLQEAISRLIESEMKTEMLARVRDEYALKVIDPGMVPSKRHRPRRTLIVIVSTLLGGAIAVFIAIVRHSTRSQLAKGNSA